MNKKIKVIVDDVELEVLVSEEEFAKLTEKKQKTGYERVNLLYSYYFVNNDSEVEEEAEGGYRSDIIHYESANYYTDKTLAENNARADKLMRQLRRFAVENCKEVPWDGENFHWFFIFDTNTKEFYSDWWITGKIAGVVYFDTKENTQKAIEIFKDELIWYFTEYRDRV